VPFGLGIWEIVILAVVLMLLFGAKGVQGAARRLGSSVREVKDAVGDLDPRGILDPKDEPAKPAALPPGPVTAGEADTSPPVTASPAEGEASASPAVRPAEAETSS
jgi:sec-independent protein translocase protein TatA